MRRYHPDVVIRLIALLKLAKAAVLITVAIGAMSLLHRHDGALGEWLDALVFDPHGVHVHRAAQRISALDDHQLEQIGIGGLAYAAVFVIEGIGLMLRRPWAEVLTSVVTTSFIPLEIYELVEHRSAAKAVVIVVNVLVVLYLVRRLRRERHWPFR
ncbi:MAG TPA: DUF2127 domain-containing protein [Kofleriaceae bacterium]|nr:DUF2127 domain-containing protein [Kofleriaceae bacterium]